MRSSIDDEKELRVLEDLMTEDYFGICAVRLMKLQLNVKNRLRMGRKVLQRFGLLRFQLPCLNIKVQILEEVLEIMIDDVQLL